MSRVNIPLIYKAWSCVLVMTLAFPALGQQLPVNQYSNITGREEVCAEQEEEYTFKHATTDCQCDNIEWTVSNGTWVTAPTTSPAPWNEKVKVKWNQGVNSGYVFLEATQCYTEYDGNGQPIYKSSLNRNKKHHVNIFDAGMVNLIVSGQSSINCLSSEITLKLNVLNQHLSPSQLSNIQWTVPANWTIKPNSQVGNDLYGAYFPNVKIATNGNTDGLNMVSVSYKSPPFCTNAIKTYARSVTFNMGCKPIIHYLGVPGFYQSHSGARTYFDFNQPSVLPGGHTYTYVAGDEIYLETNFNVVADEETTFDAFIAPCNCASPWHDPNELLNATVTIGGNYNKKNVEIIDTVVGSNSNSSDVLSLGHQEIYIYPNPSGGIVWIEAKDIKGSRTIMLHSIEGRKVYEAYHDFDAQTSFRMELSEQPKGLYIISINNSVTGVTVNKKLILE